MALADDKKAVGRFTDLMARRNIDEAANLLAPTFRYIAPGFPELKQGPHEWKALMSALFGASPKLSFTIHDQVAEQAGNNTQVAVRYTWNTVHEREFMGLAPTGKQLSVLAMAMYRVENGKIVEMQVLDDYLTLFRQLGAIPLSMLQHEMVVLGVNEKRPVAAA